ncbi:unnamed protein product [Sphagnum balticum]
MKMVGCWNSRLNYGVRACHVQSSKGPVKAAILVLNEWALHHATPSGQGVPEIPGGPWPPASGACSFRNTPTLRRYPTPQDPILNE